MQSGAAPVAAGEAVPVERPCEERPAGCEQIAPAPAEQFLRQALGSNDGDMRLPSLLLSLAVVVALLARARLRLRSRRRE